MVTISDSDLYQKVFLFLLWLFWFIINSLLSSIIVKFFTIVGAQLRTDLITGKIPKDWNTNERRKFFFGSTTSLFTNRRYDDFKIKNSWLIMYTQILKAFPIQRRQLPFILIRTYQMFTMVVVRNNNWSFLCSNFKVDKSSKY